MAETSTSDAAGCAPTLSNRVPPVRGLCQGCTTASPIQITLRCARLGQRRGMTSRKRIVPMCLGPTPGIRPTSKRKWRTRSKVRNPGRNWYSTTHWAPLGRPRSSWNQIVGHLLPPPCHRKRTQRLVHFPCDGSVRSHLPDGSATKRQRWPAVTSDRVRMGCENKNTCSCLQRVPAAVPTHGCLISVCCDRVQQIVLCNPSPTGIPPPPPPHKKKTPGRTIF